MSNELKALKKGKAQFTAIGRVNKIGDFTFQLDNVSDSGYTYSKVNIGIDCGQTNSNFYTSMMGGYVKDENKRVIYAHGKDDKGRADFKKQIIIPWEDRFDETVLKEIPDTDFITVGLVKGSDDKTVYKKFLSEYDAVMYIAQTLEEGQVVNVKGDLVYQEYNGSVSVSKNIKNIVLSNAAEDKFKATFTQTCLFDEDSVGKLDGETLLIPLECRIVENLDKWKGEKISYIQDGKTKKRLNLPLPLNLQFKVDPTKKEAVLKTLKMFKAKKGKINEITVEGAFVKGELEVKEITVKDLPKDMQDLIESGFIDAEEVLNTYAFMNGGGKKQEKMYVRGVHVNMVEQQDEEGKTIKMPQIAKEEGKYDASDLDVDAILESVGINKSEEPEEDDLDLGNVFGESSSSDDDDDWMSALMQ